MTSTTREQETDVVVLGSGLAGSVTALCLVRQGLRVMLLDRGTHPRFALGESTTTPSSLWLKVLAERYDAPELHNITTAEGVRRHVAPTSGVKSNFGFLYHERGAATMARAWQAVIPQADGSDPDLGPPQSSEMHYFRQDVDSYLWSTALEAGVIGRAGTKVVGIDFRDDGATVQISDGPGIQCAFVIDATRYRSVVASELGLRDETPRMRTRSRAMFTHMRGVRPYEEVDQNPKPLAPWSQGTLHHFFDGGWMWVIPFGNFNGSQNDLCSVGLCYDEKRFPKDPQISPETVWADFLEEYPAIRSQFVDAVPVRQWISTERLQYSSSRCVGDRFWMTAHAAGAVDALYSMGNINTFQSIATGVRLVLEAFERDTFTQEHFQPLQRLTDNLLRFQDRVVYGNYVAFRSPDLLELWFTIWGLTDGARVREVLKPLVRYARTGRSADLCSYDERPEDVLTGFGQTTDIDRAETVLDRLDELCNIMQELDEERASIAETETRLREAIEADDRYDMQVDAITSGLGQHPWLFEPLGRLGVKAYSTAFLTPDEVLTLGVPNAEEESIEKKRLTPMQALREHSDALNRELVAHRAQAEALHAELATHRDHAASLVEERDAHAALAAAMRAEMEATQVHANSLSLEQEALRVDREAWRQRASRAEERITPGLLARVKRRLGSMMRRAPSDPGGS